MKALEILKAIEEQEDTHLWLDDGSGYPKKYIIEAIKELEELENRSCENCKYFHQSYLCLELGKGNIQPKEIGLDYCNKWEAK